MIDYKESLKESLKEVFQKRYFKEGDSEDILLENLNTAKRLYADSERYLKDIADEMEKTGDDFPDMSEAILHIQTLVLSEQYIREHVTD